MSSKTLKVSSLRFMRDTKVEVWGEQEYLSLSGIQHYAFCPRQWALIHVEQQWEENLLTFRGQEMHKKVNNPCLVEKRNDTIVARAVPIVSHSLRLYGIADVVEFERSEIGVRLDGRRGLWWPVPVEYKLGRPKAKNSDTLQLCAQAICLEEMYSINLEKGYIYYGKTRTRLEILLDGDLRYQTRETVTLMHETFEAGMTPPADYTKQCEQCSLVRLCMPKLSKRMGVRDYLLRTVEDYKRESQG